jgi:hypothetical protein
MVERDPPEVFFVPEEQRVWSNASRTVAFCGWQTRTVAERGGSHWQEHARGLTAYSGHMLPKGRGPWEAGGSANELARRYGRTAPPDCNDEFGGVYTALELPRLGRGFVLTDPFGGGVLYMGSNERLVAIANRAALVARVTARPGERPARDVEGIGWLPFIGYIAGDSTGFAGVRALPVGAHIEIEPEGRCTVRRRDTPVWCERDSAWAELSSDDAIELAREDLLENMRAVAALPGTKSCRLTGGKDSRLVLALMLAAGVQGGFRFLTGGADAPDMVVAQRVAERFGLDHAPSATSAPSRTSEWIGRQVRVHAYKTSGMLGAWKTRGETMGTREISVRGQFGELMASYYDVGRSPSSRGDLFDLLLHRLRPDPGGFLREEAKEEYRRQIREWIAAQLDAGAEPGDVPDIFFLEQRLHRWFGTTEELNGLSPRVYPLQTLLGLRSAFHLGQRARRVDLLRFELMRRCCEPLAKMPFAGKKWNPGVYATLPNAADYRAAAPHTGTTPLRWQEASWEAAKPLLERYLVADGSNALFSILDWKRVSAAARSDEPLARSQKRQLYNALGAAIWLGGHEESVRVPAPS